MDNHQKILAFIKAIRESFPDAPIIYVYGGCYGFYKILKQVFPSAIPYMTDDECHVVTKIGKHFYDIKGEYIGLDGELKDEVLKLTKQQLEYWKNIACDQRVEFMLKKYKDDCLPKRN